MTYIENIGAAAKKAAQFLNRLGQNDKNRTLTAVAKALTENQNEILKANEQDVINAEKNGMKQSLIDRLMLTPKRIESMAEGILQIVSLDDPAGEVICEKTRPNGLQIGKKRVPIGVIGIIYESRPNVTADAFALCFKAGNAFF